MAKIIVLSSFISCIAILVSTGETHAFQEPTMQDINQKKLNSLEHVVNDASPAVVRIEVSKEIPVRIIHFESRNGFVYVNEVEEEFAKVSVASGSGFFVSPQGYLITNKHVVADDEAEYTVSTEEKSLLAEVVYRDPDYDLAVLKVEGEGYSTLVFQEATTSDIGDTVIAMGNALGRYIDSTTLGTISAFQKEIHVTTGAEIQDGELVLDFIELSGLIETSAKVYPGDSGGPLLDEDGRVIGVHVATAVGVRVGYAIPAAIVEKTLQKAGIEF